MSLRYRKSIKLAPGVKLNVGTKSVGVSVGGKGFRKSINSNGRVTTSVSIPGTGLSSITTETLGKTSKKTTTGGRTSAHSNTDSNIVYTTAAPVRKPLYYPVYSVVGVVCIISMSVVSVWVYCIF